MMLSERLSSALFTADLVISPSGEKCRYPFYLGTIPLTMMMCAEDIFRNYRLPLTKVYAVCIRRGDKDELVFDHDGWKVA